MTLTISDIRNDDPELAEILLGMKKEAYTLRDIIDSGPVRHSKLYEEVEKGRLRTSFCGTRRFATAVDYAKWLLLLRRETEAAGLAEINSASRRKRWRDARAASEAA